jgi:hypothetical protein
MDMEFISNYSTAKMAENIKLGSSMKWNPSERAHLMG